MENKPIYWKNLTKEDKDFIFSIYHLDASHKERIEIISKKFNGVSGRTIRSWWQKLGVKLTNSHLPDELLEAKENRIDDDTDILLVTCAQNNTLVNKGLLSSMNKYVEVIEQKYNKKAQIVVCPIRYRNPTSPTETNKKTNLEWWDKQIRDYLFYDNIYFGDVVISALSRVQPTAKVPLTGFEALADGRSLVLGHPKYQMKVLPRFSDEEIHIITTSGAVTYKNYSDSRAGEHGEIHHVYGFTIIEKRETNKDLCLVPRFVNATQLGDFIDLHHIVEKGVYKGNNSCEALMMGDIHKRVIDWDLIHVTFDLFKQIKPKKIFLHDVFDGSTVNPHETKDLYIRKKKIVNGDFKVKEEVYESINFVNRLYNKLSPEKLYVVESNHDIFLDRWVNNFDWKKDLHNSEDYLHFASIQQNESLSECGNLFGYELSQQLKDINVEYVPYGSHKRVKGILCSMHGDFGVNGSKGSISSFGRLPSKCYIGHLHSHSVFNGAYGLGVSCKLEQYYNRKGMSNWSQGHGVIYSNGKRQQLIYTKDYQLTNLI